MAIYLTRRSKLRGKESQLERAFIALVRTRVFIDFNFSKLIENLDVFIKMWCFKKAICWVEEERLCFQSVFNIQRFFLQNGCVEISSVIKMFFKIQKKSLSLSLSLKTWGCCNITNSTNQG